VNTVIRANKLMGMLVLIILSVGYVNAQEVTLAPSAPPGINILPYVISGNLIFISGQVPLENGKVKYTGKVGSKVSEAQAIEAAKLAAENVLTQLKTAVGDLNKVKRCVKLSGYVNAEPNFTRHSYVINGASDTIINALGENGRHARIAIGAASLPMDAAVEVEAIFELK